MVSSTVENIQSIVDRGVKLTPMMTQYFSIKKTCADTFLFFRMGDFYELFFEDAVQVSRLLNITLTQRGKLGDQHIPMAGIPHHAASTYIDRLTCLGLKVAICEQTEDPKDAVGIVKRAITQIVSPGMPYDLDKAHENDFHYMAAGFKSAKHFHLCLIDFTSGNFEGITLKTEDEFLEELMKFRPKEFITYMGQWENSPKIEKFINSDEILKTHLSDEYFNSKYTPIYIEKLIPVFNRDQVIQDNPNILHPIGALSYYICSTQSKEDFVHIKPFKMEGEKGKLKVTLPTLMGLEIVPKSREDYKESLLGFCDKTKTSMGSRKLKSIFTHPISDLSQLTARQDFIKSLLDKVENLDLLREKLSEIRDIERIFAKISTKKATPSDLLNLSTSVMAFAEINTLLAKEKSSIIPALKKTQMKKLTEISELIQNTLNDELGASLEKGNLIKEGFNNKRDKLANLCKNATHELDKLEIKYRKKTGIAKLRVKSNNVFGYFIEVSKAHSSKVPNSFTRRQTLVNSERYITKELAIFEKDVFSSQEKLERLEKELFNNLITCITDSSRLFLLLADTVALIDVFQGLAWVSLQEDFVCPQFFPKKKTMSLKGAWHPLIKSVIREQFVSHNLNLNEKCFFGLITGPNMAGKTTVMREVAIVQFLSQIGCFVPAKKAELGLCDYLFSRLGASDNIIKGQSTFMVEMTETAEILRHATKKSLIILDEIGRGTSTFDGLSIAWALVEHIIQKTKALTLFATHYHELIDLADKFPQAKNLTVETLNKNGDVQFLYNLIEEAASQSYGIYVAKLAGLPKDLLERSQEILMDLESEGDKKEISLSIHQDLKKAHGTQLCFFQDDKDAPPPIPEYLKTLENDLKSLVIEKMTPLEALQKLDELKVDLTLQ